MHRLLNRISIDPQVCFGKPCIKGTRIWVSLLLDRLADGEKSAELLADFPQLVPEDVTTYPRHTNTTGRPTNKSRSAANTFLPCLRRVEIVACKRA